jgi:two-component system, response regulator YesN
MKLMIVDDEEHLADSLAAGIAWEVAGVDTVFAAYSARQALEMMQEEAADIIVTDVRMPGLSGIELIKEVKSRWPHTVCMLLTGHAEFEYAQEGLKHKATHYLLKPVKDEELLAAVKEAADDRRQEQELLNAYVHSQSMVHRNLPVLRANLLNNLIRGQTITSGQLAEQLELYAVPMRTDDTVSLMMIRIQDIYKRYQASDMAMMRFAVANITEELLAHTCNSWSCEDLYGNLVFVVQHHPGCLGEQHVEQSAEEIRQAVQQLLHLAIGVAVSPEGRLDSGIEALYQRCMATIRAQLDYEQDPVARPEDEQGSPAAIVVASLYAPPLFVHLLEAGNWIGAREKLDQIMEEWKSKYSGSHEHLSEIYYSVRSAFSYFVHKNGKLLADYRLHVAEEVRDVDELDYWAANLLGRLQNELNSDASASRHSLVARIRQFIQEHLSEDVSLHAIAEEVHMHPTHVSKLFKRETGETISDYLLRLRMEKAVRLLKDSRYKVYEIAARLGYKNPTYFIKVFKERYGVTPQDFRDGS